MHTIYNVGKKIRESAKSLIYRVQLKLKEQEELSCGFLHTRHIITLMLNHSKLDLINLKKIRWHNSGLTRIEPEILRNLNEILIA